MVDVTPDPLRPTQDTRGFFMLPQAPVDSGYYTYGLMDGKPDRGGYQYAHPIMMTAILRVGLEWQTIDKRRFGVGNISRADRKDDGDHKTHLEGLEVDIRPLRKDGLHLPVRWDDANQYDQAATAKLIELFRTFAPVEVVWFNDPQIPFVKRRIKHDNHFHVGMRG
ncbi:hypothetical protein ACWV27_10085 [Massilia varians]|jgi:penicillin-insensitive murein endopeptidase